MKHRNGLLHEFVDGFVGTALDVPLDQLLEFGAKADFPWGILTLAAASACRSQVITIRSYFGFPMLLLCV
jgi:hypothetical protein